VAGLQRSNAIKEGCVKWLCVYGGISLLTNCKGLWQPTNLLRFFDISFLALHYYKYEQERHLHKNW
jgi:hypothetical protein